MNVGRYWPFGLACVVFAVVIVTMLLRRRVTLQASLSYILLLMGIGLMAIFSPYSVWVARHLGFELPSNLFFAVSIGALSFLHMISLVAQSRLELRSIVLVQEMALLAEKLERLEGQTSRPEPPQPRVTS